MKRTWMKRLIVVSCCITTSFVFQGCEKAKNNSVTEIEIVQYKPEAAAYFEELEDEFNALHDDIQLTINSPNDANAILRTRFIREDYRCWRRYQLFLLHGCRDFCRYFRL